jgi:CheY-like chemotaxis protein
MGPDSQGGCVSTERPAVLIVDDDARNCELLRRLLEMEGCRVVSAMNVRDGLERARGEPIDLVLLDVRMPGIDGFAACTRMRADPALGSLPIYLVTAFDDADVWPQARACGATGLLGKPYDRVALKRLIDGLTAAPDPASRGTRPGA